MREANRFRFPIEDYLFARGDDYVQKYRAETFLALSESIDLHRMDATAVRTPATLIAVREDQLVPFDDMQGLSARLNGPRQLIEINSIFGHDAFLKEGAALNPIIKQALSEQRHEQRRSNLENPWPRGRCGRAWNRTRSTAPWCRRSICRATLRSKATASRASTTTRAPAIRPAISLAPRSRIWREAPARW